MIDDATLDRLLAHVQKPARYVGQEWNSITKDWRQAEVTLALAYPDVYEIGMSNLGLAILYDVVNRDERFLAERVYAPWADMEGAMRAAGVPLYALESHRPLREFDVIGFTLQYELTYTNILSMLDLAGLPVRAAERTAEMPLVIAGGSGAYNPEPMADFFDLFVIGEGEEVLIELLECVSAWKRAGGRHQPNGREALLREAARIEGIYVPRFYRVRYQADGTVAAIEPTVVEAPPRVRKRIVPTLGPAPTRPVVPHIEAVHDRGMIEIQRGCSRGCRFCQAGIIYRPIRERPAQEVLAAIEALLASTGYDEVSLISLSSSDHSAIAEIVEKAMARHAQPGLAISLPSLRIDSFSVRLAEMIESRRKTGFTFAPEAGSQRLRDVINKGITEEEILATAEAVFSSGWNRIKLYFMLGLPTETEEDVSEMARLIMALRSVGRRIRHKAVEIAVSVATFVPKPHTPFQWEPLAPREVVMARQEALHRATQSREVRLSWPTWETTWLEALLSRGDRRLGRVIEAAWRLGARFDAWAECFQPTLWERALQESGLDPTFYTARRRSREEVLPWSVVDVGVSDTFLWREYERALRGELSPDCRLTCHQCGIMASFARERARIPREAWGCP